ncbi:hypothetical protein ScalyP_jg12067 [Parmales sp. scaly parma]|nr:hypothetical protein ScalyP_jg12067 [Parmales sp. scaly parma]
MMLLSTIAKRAVSTTGRRNASILSIHGREILDSRGNPTVSVDMTTTDGTFTASVPSGASTGIYEAAELRDGGSRYMGKGVIGAVANVNGPLADCVKGMDPGDQRGIDEAMIKLDGTHNKSSLGANAILGVSLAASKAGAAAKSVPLWQHYADIAGNPHPVTMPVPCFNVINGGEHAGNRLAFQEFFVIPTGASTFSEGLQIGTEVFHNLKNVIKEKFGGDATLIGDEGGFAPPCDVVSGLDMIMEAADRAGHLKLISVGLDVAASEFKVEGKNEYDLDFKAPSNKANKDPSLLLTGDELIAFYKKLIDDYPIRTIEDPFDQDDWANWSSLCSDVGARCQIVGDDLTVTNPEKIKEAIRTNACNALLLKVNQIGTISESVDAVKMSKRSNWGIMTSHRSGETEDTYIADLAVGLSTGQIKTGAPCRGERTAKYNQLLRIEQELGGKAVYPGESFRTTSWMA